MSIIALYLSSLVLCLVYAQNDTIASETDFCEAGFTYLNSKRTVNITESCKEGKCITKCCPMRHILIKDSNGTSCVASSYLTRNFGIIDPDNYSKYPVDIYDKHIRRKIIKTKKKLADFTFIYSEKFLSLYSCSLNLLEYFAEPQYKTYLAEDGKLHVRRVNYLDPWFNEFSPGDFCVDRCITINEDGTVDSASPQAEFRFIYSLPVPENNTNTKAKFSVYGMLISCFFMVLVFLVYALLKELRNLGGRMLMAYVATLTVTFICRAVQILANDDLLLSERGCSVLTVLLTYTLLSSFTWMNVISFDLWWTLRGFGRGFKFRWYCLYAWGVPLMHTLFIVVVDTLDLTHLPNFVKPHIIYDINGCYFEDDERQLYLNAPILIITFTNVVLFVVTAYNIWHTNNKIHQHSFKGSKINKNNLNRFSLHLKLSLLMGICWILEVVSDLVNPKSPLWYISDAYNSLMGLFIFICFICKKEIIVLLCKRFSIKNEVVVKWQNASCSTRPICPSEGKKRGLESVTDASDVADASC